MPPGSVPTHRFDHFELRPATRTLLANGEPVPIGSRAFDLLCALVSNRHRVVGKTELLDLVWPGRVIEENNLTVQISTLRKFLGPAAIVTVASFGYRFAKPLHDEPDAQTDASVPAPTALRPDAGPDQLAHALAGANVPVLLVVTADPGAALWLASAFAALALRHGGSHMAQQGPAWMAEFASARAATACAMDLQTTAQEKAAARLRVALVPRWSAASPADQPGPDGADLSSALQLADLACLGETLAAAAVRDRVTDTLDCRIEDLGDMPNQAAGTTIRAYRVAPSQALDPAPPRLDAAAMKPLIAIVPFEARQVAGTVLAIGDLIAEGLISLFAHASHGWRVVSRLSAGAFRGRQNLVADAQQHLGAAYVVSGSYVEQPRRLLVTLHIVDVRTGEVAHALRLDGTVGDLLSLRSELLASMFQEVQRAVHQVELRRVYSAPVPTLQSYTLMLGGIQLLHRSTRPDFDLSYKLLDQLAQWHPHAVEPRVWQAKWFAMRAVQGLSTDLLADAKAALACTGAALAIEPDNAFALAMEGFVHTHLTHDYDAARERLALAIQQNDSETFAHLYNGVVQGVSGNYSGGLTSYEVALSTSPHDPARYMMDSIGAYLYLACGRHADAIQTAKESLRHNCNHAHSWRIMAIAQQETGALDEARSSMQRIRKLQPDLTVARYIMGGSSGDAVRHRFAEALHRAGLPAH